MNKRATLGRHTSWVHFAKLQFGIIQLERIQFKGTHPQISVCIPLQPYTYIFEEHCCLHTPPEAFMPSYTPGFLCAYIFEEHCCLHTPPEAFMPSYTPGFLYVYVFEEHSCHHTFSSIAASTQKFVPYNSTREAFKPLYTPGSFFKILAVMSLIVSLNKHHTPAVGRS